MRARTCLALTVACTLALAGSALAADRQAALGDAGEIYLIHTGNYGDLFPDGTAAPAGNAVLALDVVRPGQTPQRLLVPGTDGTDVESSPFELYEPSSGALFLVWQSQINSISPVLYLTSYQGGAWSPAIRITGNPFALKSSPQFAITHDTYDILATDGTYNTVPRTILHLIWWEEAANGGSNVLYAPILLLDGTYVGTNQVFSLNSFITSPPLTTVAGAAAELFRAPQIQAGANAHSVLVGFADPNTQRLVTLEISTLPSELVSLCDKMRAHIIESGAKFLPANLTGLAANVHDWILGSGARLHPGVLSYLSDQARAHIIESGIKTPSQLTPLAADSRAHIIESGATMVGDRIDNVTAKSDSSAFSPSIAEIPTTDTDGSAGPAHLFQVNVDSIRPVPRTGSAPNAIYISQDGGDAIVSWDMPGEVRYRESTNQGWGPINALTLSSTLDLNGAHAILNQRVRDR
ncbi:MAG TPA: hypothetical protein VFE33_34630 [Thermoanaerobaculia bacterium]|nr:hypothetical protein [Thermoanaerobaculia bacterium]